MGEKALDENNRLIWLGLEEDFSRSYWPNKVRQERKIEFVHARMS